MNIDRKKYLAVFIITLGLFASVFLLVGFLDSGKRESISDLQRKITIDLIANETQFDLLKNAPCKAIEGESVLSRQMGELGRKLAYAEGTQGSDDENILELKKYYSLLEVKDYLLSQEVSKKCDIDIESLLYFYDRDCEDCQEQGYVLTELKRKYPWLRIYSFDKDLDFSIVETFASLYTISEEAPIIIIDNEKYSGFKNVEEIEELIPELVIKKEQEELKEKGLNFLKLQSEFVDVDDFEFVSLSDRELTYSYFTINPEGEEVEQKITLTYDEENEEFSLK